MFPGARELIVSPFVFCEAKVRVGKMGNYQRAMTAIFYPDGATFNGNQNILSDEQISHLKIGDVLNDDDHNPVDYSAA